MAIEYSAATISYSGNVSTPPFDFDFPARASEHIEVKLLNPDFITTTLTEGADYTVLAKEGTFPTDTGGTVTYPIPSSGLPALADGWKITITRIMPYTQPDVYPENSALNPKAIENSLDNLEMQIQQINNKADLSVRIPDGLDYSNEEFINAIFEVPVKAQQSADEAATSASEAAASANEAQKYAQDASENAQSVNIRTFANVENMKQSIDLKVGALVKTQGFYQSGDGGSSDYAIVDDISEDEVDEASIIALQNGLYARILIQDIIDVKQCGAKGNGVDDDTEAIQKAINYAGKENSGTYRGENKIVYIPEGVFIVNKPLNITTNFLTIRGTENTINYDTQPNYQEVGGSVLKKGSDFAGTNIFNITGFKCAFIYLNIICINDKTDTRNVEGFTVTTDRNLFLRCFVYGATKAYNAKGTKECQWEFCVASYSLITGYAIGGDSRLVHCKANCTGIALSGTPGIMATTKPFTDIDSIYNTDGENYYLGASIVLRDGAGNSNIIGGLFDWNRFGIICDNSDGLIVCGVRFHHNSNGNIVFRNSFGFDITGCRFLGGGFLNSRVLSAKDCIYINDTKKFTDWKYGNISGNCFRYGDWTAQEDTELNLENETAGPADNSIYINCYSDLSLNVSANSMEKSAYYSVIKVNDKSDNYIVVNFSGNTWDKPLNTTKNKNSVLFNINGFLRIYGLPTVTPPTVLTINQIPTTKNSYTTDGYCWDEYKWIGSKWIGINQRKIPSYPNNPTNFPGGNSSNFSEADDGFMYYNTTLKRYVRYNGLQWIDTNTGEVVL